MRRHANRVAATLVAHRRHIDGRPAVSTHNILPILAVTLRATNPARIQRCTVTVGLLDDHKSRRLAANSTPEINGKEMQGGVLQLSQRYSHLIKIGRAHV